MTRCRLSTDDRREQILSSVGPVVLEYGVKVTSRQLAEAAGVAEGTLFRAFGDKDSLLIAFVEREGCRAFDLSSIEARRNEFTTVSELVRAMIEVIVDQLGHYMELTMVLGPLIHAARSGCREQSTMEAHNQRFADFNQRIVDLLEPFACELSVATTAAAAAIATVAVTASSSWGQVARPLSLDDAHRILVHGLAAEQSGFSPAPSPKLDHP